MKVSVNWGVTRGIQLLLTGYALRRGTLVHNIKELTDTLWRPDHIYTLITGSRIFLSVFLFVANKIFVFQ